MIQSLFMRLREQPPSRPSKRPIAIGFREIVAGGGQIKLVQIHTIARPPAESWVAGLSNEEVDALAERVRLRTGLPVSAFYGS